MPTNFLIALLVTILLVSTPIAHVYSAEKIIGESQDILISAVGDNTLGYDDDFGTKGRFDTVLKSVKDDYSYPYKNVYDILSKDDITIANLETTLTTATKRATKTFKFHGKPEYASILTDGSVEVVNLANNHTLDYFDKGYKDTMATLKDHEIAFFGYDNTSIKEVDGVKVGMFGYTGWTHNATAKTNILKSIKKLKDQGAAIIIASYHWGIERDNYPNATQKNIAHFSIDNGVDLVLGHHPHVIQGLEKYKGKYIAYSLANFVFGGNRNPTDKDTFILQVKFSKTDTNTFTESINVIPCSVTSKKGENNYQPTPLQGKDKQRVLDRLNKYSSNVIVK
ncbi:CapA family protein [Paenibacillus psychroresistens]|uniref:CapA family protein n=1 Tax=Paenibacillus psychroresistens TaxID=1778678 RepID=A0A6B8RRQ8_9BACL|nr:CapA family protein [Paenibacillus psychroresistens]QGQ98402.1 CapA family protein [Paenibacillus psychroresistens]